VDAHGMPIKMIITSGTVNDCMVGATLIEGLNAEYLLADKGFDTDTMLAAVKAANMIPIIPPKSNRKTQREYDKYLYKLRHLVENAFLHLKRRRGIATRYAKNTRAFLAAVHIRCIFLWAKLFAVLIALNSNDIK
jgi:transposase